MFQKLSLEAEEKLRELDAAVADYDSVSSDVDEVLAAQQRSELQTLYSDVVQVKTELDQCITELNDQLTGGRRLNEKPVTAESAAADVKQELAEVLASDATHRPSSTAELPEHEVKYNVCIWLQHREHVMSENWA